MKIMDNHLVAANDLPHISMNNIILIESELHVLYITQFCTLIDVISLLMMFCFIFQLCENGYATHCPTYTYVTCNITVSRFMYYMYVLLSKYCQLCKALRNIVISAIEI